MYIRQATAADSAAILDIYSPYILNTAISFEEEIPPVTEFAARIEKITAVYPYLVCIDGGEVVGYAYASRHGERAAYRYSVGVSVYIKPDFHGRGAAEALYGKLFAILERLGYKSAFAACVSDNAKSIRFHERFGFREAGVLPRAGFKLGKWHDLVWLYMPIGGQTGTPAPEMAIRDLPADEVQRLLEM